MHLIQAHPGWTLIAILLTGGSAAVLMAISVFVGPPSLALARGFLRGGRFRRDARNNLQTGLCRLVACALQAGDEPAAQLLEQVALALRPGADLGLLLDFLRGADPGLHDVAAGPVQAEETPASPVPKWMPEFETPVFSPGGSLLGFLTNSMVAPECGSLALAIPPLKDGAVADDGAPKDRWLTVTIRRRSAGWESAFSASALRRALPAGSFRAAAAIHPISQSIEVMP